MLSRICFGPRPNDIERVRSTGAEEYIHQQLHPERINDSAADARVLSMASIRMTAAQVLENYREPRELVRRLLDELAAHKIVRAVHSERQLQEVMTDFWFNHFNVFWGKNADRFLTTAYEMNAIRPHVLGRFKDLLMATAKSPAMLFYLDNHLSSVQRGINENYARELMELHTLGVDGGYTQKDVQEVARAFTGWAIDAPQRSGAFLFRPRMHDNGEKVVLGHKIDGGGIGDGERVIEILARHASTARFISTKLVRRFVSDHLPEPLVKHVADVYDKTGGDIREMMRAILTSKEFNSPDALLAKTKTPFEYAVSAIRSLDGETGGSRRLAQAIARMGQPLYQYQAPAGFPDRGDYWMGNGAILERLNFAVALSANRIPGTTVRIEGPAKSVVLRLGSPDFQKR
ncbi:MAG: DUF1800 domain-containing protein [Acidobacteria bacterium]|nr:DUF1800 domain-containing protein [Acidobacteriota bacterium]